MAKQCLRHCHAPAHEFQRLIEGQRILARGEVFFFSHRDEKSKEGRRNQHKQFPKS